MSLAIIRNTAKLQYGEYAKGAKRNVFLEEFYRYDAIYHSLMDAIDNADINKAIFYAACLADYVGRENGNPIPIERIYMSTRPNAADNNELLHQLFDEIDHEERLNLDLSDAKEEIKSAQDHAKGINSALERSRAKIRELKSALNGKSFGPLFDKFAGKEDQIPSEEGPVLEEITFEITDDQILRLTKGEEQVEVRVEEAETLLLGGETDYPTMDAMIEAVKNALDAERLSALWDDLFVAQETEKKVMPVVKEFFDQRKVEDNFKAADEADSTDRAIEILGADKTTDPVPSNGEKKKQAKRESSGNEIMTMRKPDGSLLLKTENRIKIIRSDNLQLLDEGFRYNGKILLKPDGNINLDQDQLQALWVSDKAEPYNASEYEEEDAPFLASMLRGKGKRTAKKDEVSA